MGSKSFVELIKNTEDHATFVGFSDLYIVAYSTPSPGRGGGGNYQGFGNGEGNQRVGKPKKITKILHF